MLYHIHRYVSLIGEGQNRRVLEVYEGSPINVDKESDAQVTHGNVYFVEIPIPFPVQIPGVGMIAVTTDNLSPLDATSLEEAFKEAETKMMNMGNEVQKEINKPSKNLVLVGG